MFTASDLAAGEDRRELERTLRDGRAEDTRWHVRKDGQRFWANGMAMSIQAPQMSGVLKIMRDETPAKRADEQRLLLLNELNHRINNTLATVQSIAEQTLRSGAVSPVTRAALMSRLMALSEAHRILVDENWAGADLATVIARATAPHETPGAARFKTDGPALRLSPSQALAMSLALHELATNAIKHGALSVPAGWVAIDWNLAHDGEGGRHLTFTWTEHGGPRVASPSTKGFGSRLLARTFEGERGGHLELRFEAAGLRCLIELTLSDPSEAPPLTLASEPAPLR